MKKILGLLLLAGAIFVVRLQSYHRNFEVQNAYAGPFSGGGSGGSGGVGLAGSQAAGNILTYLNASTANTVSTFTLTSGGNVGIGTTSPAQILHVSGNNARIRSDSTTGTSFVELYNQDAQAAQRNWDLASNVSNRGSLDIRVGAAQGGSPITSVLTLNSAGNVGIGTTSPATILHVNSTINNAAIIKSTGKGVAYGRTSNDFGEVLWGVDGIAGTEINTGGLPYASFLVSNSTNALQLGANASIGMTIVNGGNVGVGTTSPGALLDVRGASFFGTAPTQSTMTASGFWQPPSYTTANLGQGGSAPAPGSVGVIVYNSTIKDTCISTGTVASNWSLSGSKGATGCY